MSDIQDRWVAGARYEDFMGRWSRQLAPRFVRWLAIPAGVHWLDVGCGTGALADAIGRHAEPASVVACDPAQPLIEHARAGSAEPRIAFVVAGVPGLPRRPGGYGSVSSCLSLNFVPDATAAVEEMRSLASPGGTLSACVWDYAGGMGFLRRFWDAAAETDPAARELDEGRRFPLCRPAALEGLFRGAGLREVRCEPIEIPTEFASFEDYWRPLLGGTGPAPSYVASLDAERRSGLARALDRALPRGPGGTIALTARAWAVRGSVD